MPSSSISDRAKRYRANSETSEWPEVCMFCGASSDLQRDHLDGFEENGEPENLLILCRSCNQLKSNVYLRAGLGRRTVQYNPGFLQSLFGPRETYRVHGAAHPEERRKRAAELRVKRERERAEDRELRKQEIQAKRDERAVAPKAVGRYKGFTIYKRRQSPDSDFIYYSTMDQDSWLDSPREVKKLIDSFKNPASSLSAYQKAVDILRGDVEGSPFQAARMIRSTPIARRYQFLDQMMRRNSASPTFAQYAWAVANHTRGAHDEGGAIIHATPKAKRREYAEKIAGIKTRRRDAEVPF